MLSAILNLHLSKFRSNVARDMKKNIYVDKILFGCNTEREILNYYMESKEIIGQANFNLRSWSSNCQSLQKAAARTKQEMLI